MYEKEKDLVSAFVRRKMNRRELIDRMAKLALNNGIAGALEAPSSYLMKSPPVQIVDSEAHENIERFIKQNALKTEKKGKATAKA